GVLGGGRWLSWDVTGHVIIDVANQAGGGSNAVVSGIFFGGSGTPHFTSGPTVGAFIDDMADAGQKQVNIQATTDLPTICKTGATPFNSDSAPRTDHTLTLINLTPGQSYSYDVICYTATSQTNTVTVPVTVPQNSAPPAPVLGS